MDFRGWISRRTGGRIDRVVDPGSTPFSCLRVSFRENSRKNARRGVSKDSGKGGGDNSRNTRPSCSGCRCSVRSLTPRHNGPTECETKIMVAACKPMNRFNTPFPSPPPPLYSLSRHFYLHLSRRASVSRLSLCLSQRRISVHLSFIRASISPPRSQPSCCRRSLFSELFSRKKNLRRNDSTFRAFDRENTQRKEEKKYFF